MASTWEDTVMKENQIGSRPLYCRADEEMIRLGLSRLELFRICKDAGFLNSQAETTWPIAFEEGRKSRDKEVEEAKNALEAARAAILDAIYCEDGLDGHTGSAIMEWITDILGDEKEYRPTIEGISSQTQILEDRAFQHRDQVVQQAKEEARKLGRKDVVDFIHRFWTAIHVWESPEWQSQLKEWGIEVKE